MSKALRERAEVINFVLLILHVLLKKMLLKKNIRKTEKFIRTVRICEAAINYRNNSTRKHFFINLMILSPREEFYACKNFNIRDRATLKHFNKFCSNG